MNLRPFPLFFSLLVGACSLAAITSAQDQSANGNLFVNLNLDVNGNTSSFGVNGANPGYSLIYTNGVPATVDFSASAAGVNWVWSQSTSQPQLKIDSSNTLSLFAPGLALPSISLNPAGTSVFSQGLTVTGTLTASGGFASPNGIVTGGATGLSLQAGGTGNQNIALVPTGTGVTTTDSPLAVKNTTVSTSTTSGALTVAGGVGVAGKLNVASDVSIGTSASTARLTVVGAGITSATASANFTDSANKSLLFVRNDGNVGVSTTTPAEKLDVIGNMRLSGSLVFPGLGNDHFAMHNLGEGLNAEVRLVVGDNALQSESDRLSIGATDYKTGVWYPRFTVMSSGNVGIGTTTPTVKLHVVGDSNVSGTTTLSGAVTITAPVTIKSVLRLPASGDLSMGAYTNGTNPTK